MVPVVGMQLAEVMWGWGGRARGLRRRCGKVAGWGTGPALGTGLASGRGLPTVALFPAGAENFASVGAARERETSTPGYRPGLRRRGGQRGGTSSPASPRAAVGQGPAGAAPGWAMPARRAWHPVPGFGSRDGARIGQFACLRTPRGAPHALSAPMAGARHPQSVETGLAPPDFPTTSPLFTHVHCTPLQRCTQTLLAHTPSHLRSARHHPLPVPRPHPAWQDSHLLYPELLELPRGLASPLQHPHIPVLRRAPQLGAEHSWGCWDTRTRVSMCKHPPSGTYTCMPYPTGGKCCMIQPCPTARPRLIKQGCSGQGISESLPAGRMQPG